MADVRFLQLDDNICNNPVRQLPSIINTDDGMAREAFAATALPAAAGAVVGTVVVDVEGQGVYTAVVSPCIVVSAWRPS